MLGTYWIFCIRCRYNRRFFSWLTAGLIIAVILLCLAHPEVWYYPPLILLGIILILSPVIIAFDYYSYKRYLKQISRTYKEKHATLDYELLFDEKKLLFNNGEVLWSRYKFYYIGEHDIYIFRTRREPSIIWSANSMDKEVFVDLISYTKQNLKILPISKKIIFK